ncbi:MFS transporter [Phenylobacterium montanum]|uniref:MFS transporter n=1 Tax=Phenylobacterium montanum TaxID=2823693 RepID=A0A975IW64_9CAUL|nr:MFS transporter [Caulobacter sp. S6]QUD89747.1 MFS transporter [Caulobacter sp. S6]
MSKSAAPKGLSFLGALAFAGPGLPMGAFAVALAVYLPNHYASRLGLPLAIVGAAFMGVRLIDIMFDPAIGLLMDRSRTPLGRYRLWMVAGAPIFAFAAYQLFMAQAGVSAAYLVGWLLAFYIGYSIILLSHISWASTLARDYHERSRIFGFIQVVSVAGATAVLLIPALMAKAGHGGGVEGMGWFLVAVTPLGVLMALARTREPPPLSAQAEHFTLKDYWEMIVRPDMRRIIVADFCLALGPGWMSASYLFYFRDVRGFTIEGASQLLLLYVAAGLIGAAVLSRVAVWLGKHRTLMLASTGYSLGLVVMTTLPKGSFALTAPFMFLMGFLATSFTLLDRAMVADVSDAVRLETGKQRIGVLYALITSVQKVAGALSIFVTFKILSLVGYDPKAGAINTPDAIHGLSLVYLIGPVVFVMLGGACYFGYKLDAKKHAQIRAELEARDALAPEPAVLETLSSAAGLPSTAIEPEPT